MFDLSVVNAFSASAVTILKSYCHTGVRKGNVIVKNSFSPLMGLGVFIGINGSLDGKLMIDMEKDTAFALASKLNEETIDSVDDIFIATIKEFANMVAGGAINELSTRNIDLDMTTPTLFMGEHMSIVEQMSEEILVITYDTDFGCIAMNLIIKKKR